MTTVMGPGARVRRNLGLTARRFPFAWCNAAAVEARRISGDDMLPCRLAANRTTLEAFRQYAWEPGVCHRRVSPEELFPKELSKTVKV